MGDSNKMPVVDNSMADQKSSLHSVPSTVANHNQAPIDGDAMKPIGDKAMQSGKFN